MVAVLAAGASDRLHDRADVAQSALWAAGFTPQDQHALATMASVARSDLGAESVEVVLAPPGWSGDGIVVTGSRLGAERLGSRVEPGKGAAGRALAARRRALVGGADGVAVAAVPLGELPGVVVVRASPERLLTADGLGRLEALATKTARQLAAPVARTS